MGLERVGQSPTHPYINRMDKMGELEKLSGLRPVYVFSKVGRATRERMNKFLFFLFISVLVIDS